MGKGMARNLKKAGAELYIHNRSKPAVAQLAMEGMQACASPAEIAADIGNGVIIIMVTDTPSVEAALFGSNGVAERLHRATLVIDMGTTGIRETRAFAARIRQAGGDYMDAPVSGGQAGADFGNLTIMAGGEAQTFARALPYFQAMGKSITHVGSTGAGQIAKVANQVIVALTVDAVAQAFAIAEAAGVAPAKLRQAIEGGSARSFILENQGQKMIEGRFVPGGRATVVRKDVRQALEFAEHLGLDLPALRTNLAQWEKLIAAGDGDLDHSGIIRLYQKR
jgi:3-hydroxyisobutyrate dehydrogenase-like beta-hydroxyacid dehydrogenase